MNNRTLIGLIGLIFADHNNGLENKTDLSVISL